jgi:uncharacterized protein (DUF433 family)
MAIVEFAGLEQVVSCSPEVMGGVPVFAGTRVPVKSLWDYLAGGEHLLADLVRSEERAGARSP